MADSDDDNWWVFWLLFAIFIVFIIVFLLIWWFKKPSHRIVYVEPYEDINYENTTYVLQKPMRQGFDEMWKDADKYKKYHDTNDEKYKPIQETKYQPIQENIFQEEKYPFEENVFEEKKLNPQSEMENTSNIYMEPNIAKQQERPVYGQRFRHYTDTTEAFKSKANANPQHITPTGKSFTSPNTFRIRRKNL